MPAISLFFGIIIRMFWRDNDKHKTPHMHAYYGDYEAVFALDGDFLKRSVHHGHYSRNRRDAAESLSCRYC